MTTVYTSSYSGEEIDSGIGLALTSAQSDDVETATINAQTGTSYTAVIGDRGQVVTMSADSANEFVIPSYSSVPFGVGSVLSVLQIGSGVTTISAVDSDVTLNGIASGSGAINNQYQGASLLKVDSDTWIASGDIGTVA